MNEKKTLSLSLVIPFVFALGCAGEAKLSASAGTPPQPPPAAPAPAPPPAEDDVGEAHLKGDHIEIEHQIRFDSDSDHIDEEHSPILKDLVGLLSKHGDIVHLRIEGHTDEQGSHDHNQDLSERRAAAVAKYINDHGLPNVKIETLGHGETKRLCTDTTDECHEKNRRVEFIVVKD